MLAALAAILTAAACTAQVLPLSAPVNPAAPGSLPWRVLTWRDRAGATLRETPLRALRSASGSTLTSEWAPLYRGRDGVRVEQAQQLARFAERAGSLRMGAELRRDVGAFRGGKTRWGVDAAGEALRGGSLGLACVRSAMAIAAGASLSSDGRAGLALEGEVSLCPA